MSQGPTAVELRQLEEKVERALASGDEGELKVLGYGEISAVLGLHASAGDFAAKRLPLFDSTERLAAYRVCLENYLERLSASGLVVVPTQLEVVERVDGRWAAYCVQPILPARNLVPAHLSRCTVLEGVALFNRILDAINATIGNELGLDAQASNWVFDGRELSFLDVSTPMMRDANGHEALDTDLFIASLPWLLRGGVRRFLLGSILDKYYDFRGAVLDFLGNLYKEQLEQWLPTLIEIANTHISPPLTAREIRKYYVGDARLWELLIRLRRLDRAWQRRTGRVYPFLLPGEIVRHV